MEVTYLKRALILVVVFVALLALAAPAFAFNGFRADYTTTVYCQGCHTVSPGTPVYNEWVETKHAVSNGEGQATRSPEGSSCAGCHTANYDPGKVSPSPSGTSYVYANAPDPYNATAGNAASSELVVGCSSCHYGSTAGVNYGGDTSNTAHTVAMQEMANADICGQCHSRYSYTANTYNINPVPTPGAVTMVQPQYAIGFQMLGNLANGFVADPLSSNLIVQHPGWTPSPNPTATTAAGLMTYWKNQDGSDTMWQAKGHDGSAAQYPEWQTSLHEDALTGIMSAGIPNSVIDAGGCLKCHSADYRLAKAGSKPLAAKAKYGITCVGCHTPHEAGHAKGVFDEAFDVQLVGDPANPSDVCTTCHTNQVDGVATAGTEIHNATKQIMNGVGAIGVDGGVSLHKGKCIQCHMVPTSYSRGSVQLGANHTMTIIDPEVAVDVKPTPVATTTAKATATPTPGTVRVTTTLTVTQDTMPYSACSTCHNNNVVATPQPVATATTTPTPAPAATEAVTVTITQNKAGGDKGEYLQGTIEQRQAQTDEWIAECDTALAAAATRLGYGGDVAAANEALNDEDMSMWTADEMAFQKSFTNIGFVKSEGSRGIHNWAYSSKIAQKAIEQANSVRKPLASISMNMNPAFGATPTYAAGTPLVFGGTLTVWGNVQGGDPAMMVGSQVKLWRKNNDSTQWNIIASTYLEGDNSNEYMFTVVPSKSAVYKVQYAGNDTYAPLTLGWNAGADVKWSVSFKTSATTVKKNAKITYSGAIGPGTQAYALFNVVAPATPQKLIIQKKSGSAWKTWKSINVNPDGSYKLAIKMTSKGKFTMRAFFKGNSTTATPPVAIHLDGNSGNKTITVK